MSGIRINKLCNQFGVGTKELIAFLSSKGIMASSNPNSKVPESVIPLLQKEYGNKENTEASPSTPIEIVPVETKIEPSKSMILPDSPFRIGTSGKFKLLIKSVEEKFGDYEYLLIDADEKEYKAIAKALYAEGQILRCMVSFKVERARLVVENVAVCSKQDLATPVPVKEKPIAEPKPNSTPTHKAVSESKKKATSKRTSQSKVSDITIELGNPRKRLVSGNYILCVRSVEKNDTEYSYKVEDANGKKYPFQSKRLLKVGYAYFFYVDVSVTAVSGLIIEVIKVVSSYKKKATKSEKQEKQKRTKRKRHSRRGGATGKVFYREATGYRQQNWEPTIYKGGGHIIYTRM